MNTTRCRQIVMLLVVAGFAGALLSSNILAAATLLAALAGVVLIRRRALEAMDWDRPRELRLLHFSFWFFLLVYVGYWAASGFDYAGLKELDGPARFILFWPLVIAITWSGMGARPLFVAVALMTLGSSANVILDLMMSDAPLGQDSAYRPGLGVNPIILGNLALLGALMLIPGALYFYRSKASRAAWLSGLIAMLGLITALLTQTRSNFLVLPVLLLLVLLLLQGKYRWWASIIGIVIMASALAISDRALNTLEGAWRGALTDISIEYRLEIWKLSWDVFLDQPVTGAGLAGYRQAVEDAIVSGDFNNPAGIEACCMSHAHNDLLQTLATRGLIGGGSWLLLLGIPLAIFMRHARSGQLAVSHVAVAATMIPVAYLLFGLTEAALSRSQFVTFYLLSVASFGSVLFIEVARSFTRKRSVRVSAIIITKNEESNVVDCIKSARLVADEIIVLDSGSTDRTVAMARCHADIVEETDWPGFGLQKQRALEKVTGEWVLSIDADERVSPGLAMEINHVLGDPDADAYRLPWAVTIYGTRLDFGRSGRAPLRLFRREGVSFSPAQVHEAILLPKGRKVRTLQGRLIHYTHRDFGHALEKSAWYAWLWAQERFSNGKRSRWLVYPTLRGVMTFIQVYFVRLGFLDGATGYLVAVNYAQGAFNKYAGLWTLTRNSARSRDD